MIDAIERAKTTEQWRSPQYIPHPATWLNRKGWEDEEAEPQQGHSNAVTGTNWVG
jgi:hypothetical protein